MREYRRQGNAIHAAAADRRQERAAAWLPSDTGAGHLRLKGRAPIALAFAAALSLTGCSALMRASHTPTQPPAAEAWARTTAVAASEVGAGSYAAADRALADFTARYPHTPQAVSATLRRAVYMADPANQAATARDATALLDSTLAEPLDSASRSDARTLRRITSALQRAATLSAGGGANVSTADSSARSVDTRSNSEEIQRLRNELAKANAELERIKKRVAQPKP